MSRRRVYPIVARMPTQRGGPVRARKRPCRLPASPPIGRPACQQTGLPAGTRYLKEAKYPLGQILLNFTLGEPHNRRSNVSRTRLPKPPGLRNATGGRNPGMRRFGQEPYWRRTSKEKAGALQHDIVEKLDSRASPEMNDSTSARGMDRAWRGSAIKRLEEGQRSEAVRSSARPAGLPGCRQ